MEIIIEWSELAEIQLKDIFDYYSFVASSRTAKKIINEIIERVEILYQNPLAGPKEDLLAEYTEEFRYLVEGKHKIIYWKKNNTITIASVFDCRQNPKKMKII